MTEGELERQAIHESVRVVPYEDAWAGRFESERDRLVRLVPEFVGIEHIGSTAVPGMAAKPIIDIMAGVSSMDVADTIVERLCGNGYITSAAFNRALGDRRWLMRQRGGHRTDHLHLVLRESPHWVECLRFRDLLRKDGELAAKYADLKRGLASRFGSDRDGYGNAKAAFIASAISAGG